MKLYGKLYVTIHREARRASGAPANGHIYPLDADDLAEKLRMVMEDKGLRDELARRGRQQRVLGKYTQIKIAEETYKVYQQLVGERS